MAAYFKQLIHASNMENLLNIARHHKVPFLLGIKGASKNWPALASRDRGLNILNCISSKGLLGYTLYLL